MLPVDPPYLAEDNFLLYAAKAYANTQCYDLEEFYEDLKRFKYLKRLFNSYQREGDLKERLVLNHIISLVNVFGPEPTVRMIFAKLPGYEPLVVPFLRLLGVLPQSVYGIGSEGRTIHTAAIEADSRVVEALKGI